MQDENAYSPIEITESGMVISVNAQPLNAYASILVIPSGISEVASDNA
jgi:hypothetical protein